MKDTSAASAGLRTESETHDATNKTAHLRQINAEKENDMVLIEKYGNIEIWHDKASGEFYVYGVTKDPRVVPSIGMAREVAAQ